MVYLSGWLTDKLTVLLGPRASLCAAVKHMKDSDEKRGMLPSSQGASGWLQAHYWR